MMALENVYETKITERKQLQADLDLLSTVGQGGEGTGADTAQVVEARKECDLALLVPLGHARRAREDARVGAQLARAEDIAVGLVDGGEHARDRVLVRDVERREVDEREVVDELAERRQQGEARQMKRRRSGRCG